MRIRGSGIILLVEDDYITAMMEALTIRRWGSSLILARSGEEALLLVSAQPRIDLVLMDVHLGAGMDGIETAFELRKLAGTPIIFLTSSTEAEVRSRTQGLSSWAYLEKLGLGRLKQLIRENIDGVKADRCPGESNCGSSTEAPDHSGDRIREVSIATALGINRP